MCVYVCMYVCVGMCVCMFVCGYVCIVHVKGFNSENFVRGEVQSIQQKVGVTK